MTAAPLDSDLTKASAQHSPNIKEKTMGDISEAMLDGCLCAGCGDFLGAGDGFPTYCHSCSIERKAERKTENIARNKAEHAAIKKISCAICGKKVKVIGMANHIKDAHGVEVLAKHKGDAA